MIDVDKFRFRTGFTAHIKDEFNDDADVQVVLEDCFFIESYEGILMLHKLYIKAALDEMDIPEIRKQRAYEYWEEHCHRCEECEDFWFIRLPDFLEQSTGLKDRNHNLIFEGDILRPKYSDTVKYVVYRGDTGFRYKAYSTIIGYNYEDCDCKYCDDGELFADTSVFEIIGNIRDSRELFSATTQMIHTYADVKEEDVGTVCAFYDITPTNIVYDVLAGFENNNGFITYLGESGIKTHDCRRLLDKKEMTEAFRCLKQKNG